MTYRILCERKSVDAEARETFVDTIHDAVREFEHAVIMAVQHGEWSRVQVIPVKSRELEPRPVLAYDANGLDIEVINEQLGTYRWIGEGGTVWTRPTAYAYAQTCKAYNRYRYGDGSEPQFFGVKELGSDKWLSVHFATAVKPKAEYRYVSNNRDATRYSERADAARQIRKLIEAGEAGDFHIEPLN